MNPDLKLSLNLPIQALETFSAHLARGSKVLCADPAVSEWLAVRGLEIQDLPAGKDLRFLSLKRETYAGVWAGNTLMAIPIDDAQRVIAAFFQALVPGKGVFFAAHAYPRTAFASLLRQNGYLLLMEGQNQNIECMVSQRI